MDRFDFLRRVFFFRNLTDEELNLVLEACHEERYDAGDVLFSEGSMADRFFIVIHGRVEVWKDYYEKKPSLLGLHGPGHFFGEMALLDELPRSATVVAKEELDVLFLYRDDFKSLIVERSAIALSVMMSMSFLVRSSNEVYVDDLRRRNEELESANEELKKAHSEHLRDERLSTLGKFSSMILHDIRNPISMIMGQLTLIQGNPTDLNRVERSANAAFAEALKLERLANEFLDYSRGEIRLDASIVEPSRLISSVASSVAFRLEMDKIRLLVESAPIGRTLLDYDRMQRVLHNLVDNARKALLDIPPEKRQIRIAATYEDSYLVLEVEDTGTGMTEDVRNHLFEPFYSASGHGGTGLGLLIVRNIVEAHGGTLRVRSNPGEGTTFTVKMPRRT